MNREGIRKIIVLLPGVLCALALAFVLWKWVVPVAAPFIIAWLSATAVRAPAVRMSAVTRIPERVCRAFLAIFFTLMVFGVFGVFIWQLAAFLAKFAVDISNSGALEKIIAAVTEVRLPFGDTVGSDGIGESIKEGIQGLISKLVSSLGSLVASFAAAVPKSFLFIVVTVISIVYFALDLEKINSAVSRILPDRWARKISLLRERFFKICYKYVKSYLQMMLITFALLLVGFLIIGERRAVSLAIVVSLVDLLPILGIGTVLVPWSVFCLAAGELVKGVSLLILFVVAVVVRELLEPRIMGKNLGIHPLLTLITIYVGYELFGFLGMIFLPAVAVTVSALFDKDDTSEIG